MKNECLNLAVKMFYDLQRVRIQVGGRLNAVNTPQGIELDEKDLNYFSSLFGILQEQEKATLKYISKLLTMEQIWIEFLKDVKGIGPAMGGVIISQYDIEKAHTVSALWCFTGLNVVNGKAPRPVKGEKLKYNKWLRSKMVGVLGPSFLKSNSPYREFYDNYKHRLESRIVPCMACEETGRDKDDNLCANCKGTSQGPWGKSDGHRHNASIRYMIKMFLADLYKVWRLLEGLPIREPYQVEYLGHEHSEKTLDN